MESTWQDTYSLCHSECIDNYRNLEYPIIFPAKLNKIRFFTSRNLHNEKFHLLTQINSNSHNVSNVVKHFVKIPSEFHQFCTFDS